MTASGKTVEEAVERALKQLDTTKENVEVTIVDEGKKGLFGIFGSKLAIVSVKTLKDQVKEAEKFILEVTKNMGVDVSLTTTVKGKSVTFELQGEKIALLIGKRGQTLNALQYLIHLAINKDGAKFYRVTLDAEGYRGRRQETLEDLALKMADKAKRLKEKVTLEPMPAYERKIIHSALQNRKDITTYSDGVEPHRYIVVKP